MGESIKKVTVNLPEELLLEAKKATGAGITETIIQGLAEIGRREKRRALSELKGKVSFDLDLEKSRR